MKAKILNTTNTNCEIIGEYLTRTGVKMYKVKLLESDRRNYAGEIVVYNSDLIVLI